MTLDPHVVRSLLAAQQMAPADFRAALESVSATERDAWVDRVLELDDCPPDSSELPSGCVPYLPCSVNTLLSAVALTDLQPDDVFVDIGSGLGRCTVLTHLLTGAGAIGIEIQSDLVRRSRELALRLNASRVVALHGDATQLARFLPIATVFFLYCPFGRDRVNQLLDAIQWRAQTRAIHVCSVQLALPERNWLTPVSRSAELSVYRSLR